MTKRFRKKPVEIEAILCSDALKMYQSDMASLPGWLATTANRGNVTFFPDAVHIRTLEGTMIANPTDWILCGVKGELYPCRADIFEATYDPV